MNKVYGRLLGLIAFVALVSGIVIYTTVDINTLRNITVFKPWSIALAIMSVGLGLVLDGTRLMHLVRISDEHITLKQAVQVVFGNYFLALLTPGSVGGAVAQLMFLRHAGVPAGKATVLAIVRTVVSILFLACCLPFIFMHDSGVVPGISNKTLMIIACVALAVIIFFAWAFHTNLFDYFVIRLTKRFSNRKRLQIFAFYRDVKTGVRLLAQNPKSMVRVFIESGLSLMAIYAIVPCLLLGLGVTDADWYTVMGRMIFLNMLLYFMPTPGGSGIAEGGFVLLFSDTAPAGTVGIIAVFWRAIAEYIPFVIGFYYTVTVFGRRFLDKEIK